MRAANLEACACRCGSELYPRSIGLRTRNAARCCRIRCESVGRREVGMTAEGSQSRGAVTGGRQRGAIHHRGLRLRRRGSEGEGEQRQYGQAMRFHLTGQGVGRRSGDGANINWLAIRVASIRPRCFRAAGAGFRRLLRTGCGYPRIRVAVDRAYKPHICCDRATRLTNAELTLMAARHPPSRVVHIRKLNLPRFV